MRTPYAVSLLLALIGAGVFWYASVGAICKTPISYRVGTIDERFNISNEEARNVIEAASSIWENATDRNLFTYQADGAVAINFVYDERQQTADEAERLKDTLADKKNQNESFNQSYETLVANYNNKKQEFESLRNSYDRKLDAYNKEVDDYNQNGGAPQEVYADLEKRKVALDKERTAINSMATELNRMGVELNELGEKGNEIVEDYNTSVSYFNSQFGHSEEFTQGDYVGDEINIYKFETTEELELVLAHELGHALSIDHVEDKNAIMYYLMGDQPIENIALSQDDLTAFASVCGEVTPTERLARIRLQFATFFQTLGAF